MSFKTFYKNIIKSDYYDILIERKPSEFKDLTSKGYMAVLYISDLLDQRKKVKDIIKLFPAEEQYQLLIKEIFRARLEIARDSKQRRLIVWDKAKIFLDTVEKYNKKFVQDQEYFDLHSPFRKLQKTPVELSQVQSSPEKKYFLIVKNERTRTRSQS